MGRHLALKPDSISELLGACSVASVHLKEMSQCLLQVEFDEGKEEQ